MENGRKLQDIETCAGRVREDGEILVVIGIGGSNQAAKPWSSTFLRR
ncbi:MAG: hypothetical protein ACLUKO_26150 [Enterocloster bolteae]